MVLVPLLSGQLGQRQLFPTCVGVMAPICCVSAAVYFFRADFSFLTALPYLIGGAAGGLLGGHFYRRVPTVWLKRAFALFLLYGGARYLL